MPPVSDIMGYIAFATNVWGNWLLTNKKIGGWQIRIVSHLAWGAFGVLAWSLPNLLNAATFFVINCVGWYRWRKEEKAREG